MMISDAEKLVNSTPSRLIQKVTLHDTDQNPRISKILFIDGA